MTHQSKQILTWAPRIVTLLYAAFLSIFAFEVFGDGPSFGQELVAFFWSLLPALMIVGLLIMAWNKPQNGAIAYGTLFCIFMIFFNSYESLAGFIAIIIPLITIAFLFYIDYKVLVYNPQHPKKQKVKDRKKTSPSPATSQN